MDLTGSDVSFERKTYFMCDETVENDLKRSLLCMVFNVNKQLDNVTYQIDPPTGNIFEVLDKNDPPRTIFGEIHRDEYVIKTTSGREILLNGYWGWYKHESQFGTLYHELKPIGKIDGGMIEPCYKCKTDFEKELVRIANMLFSVCFTADGKVGCINTSTIYDPSNNRSDNEYFF
jgi:hypothetical protein